MAKAQTSIEGLAVGLSKGYKVTKRDVKKKQVKGVISKRKVVVKEIIRDICGFTPYEKRMMELLKIGKDKRCLKFAKKRIGSHTRAKRKREEMQGVIAAARK